MRDGQEPTAVTAFIDANADLVATPTVVVEHTASPAAVPERAKLKGSGHAAMVAVVCIAQLTLAVDVTIVLVANATIQRALHFSAANIEWLVTAYSLAFGGFLLVGGQIADRVGNRRMFVLGMAGFTAASVGSGLAHTSAELVAFRAAQGLSAALISPTALGALGVIPAGPVRERAYALWATAGSAGGVVGYTAGSFLLNWLGWRWIFFINVPIGIVVIAGALRVLPKVREPKAGRGTDVAGAVSVTVGLALLIFGLGRASGHGWGSATVVASLLVAVVLVTAFFAIETRVSAPIVPLDLFRHRAAFGNLCSAMQAMMVTGTIFLGSLYLQEVLGYSAERAGLATLPIPLGVALGASLATRSMARWGSRRTACTGAALLTAGTAWLAVMPDGGRYAASFLPSLALFGVGLGLAAVPLISIATSETTPEHRGVVAGVYSMGQQTGSALGLGVLATIAAAGTHAGGSGQADAIRVSFVVAACFGAVAVAVGATCLPGSRRPASAGPVSNGK